MDVTSLFSTLPLYLVLCVGRGGRPSVAHYFVSEFVVCSEYFLDALQSSPFCMQGEKRSVVLKGESDRVVIHTLYRRVCLSLASPLEDWRG